MQKRYPFKFLDAYEKKDTDIFFGRDEEVEALYQMTYQSDILLVYGGSGTGKTSLINAGLAGRFQAHDWLALTIRRGNNLNESLQRKLDEVIGSPAENPELDLSWLDDEEDEISETSSRSSLSQKLKDIYLRYFRPVYLIFDQFEELYILGDKAEQRQFIEHIKEIQAIEQPIKIIIVIREEYLGHLFEFERAVPQLLRKKLRVEQMSLDKVGQVIRGAASLKGSNIQLKAGEEDQIVESIFQKIKGDETTLAIQLPYLQVFLDKLYLHITGDDERQADAEFNMRALNEIGEIEDVLRDFLEEQVVKIRKNLSAEYPGLPQDIVWQILSPLATLEGTKEPMLEDSLFQRLGHIPTAAIKEGLIQLEKGRILRYDENEKRYEVAHDSLAKRIAERRSDDEIALLEIQRLITNQLALKAEARELFTEKQMNFIEPYLNQLLLDEEASALIEQSQQAIFAKKEEEKREAEEEKQRLLERQALLEKNQRTQRMFIRFMGAALIVAIALGSFAYYSYRKSITSEAGRVEALGEKEKAERLAALERARADSLAAVAREKEREKYNPEIRAITLDEVEEAPLLSIIKPRAEVDSIYYIDDAGRQNYLFRLWLDMPKIRQKEINKVTYFFNHPTFFPKDKPWGDPKFNGSRYYSDIPSNSNLPDFGIIYQGFTCLETVQVWIEQKNTATVDTLYLSMCKDLSGGLID